VITLYGLVIGNGRRRQKKLMRIFSMFLVIVPEVKKMSIVADSKGASDKNGFIFLDGAGAGIPVIVQTTPGTVEGMINKYSKKVCKKVFPQVWKALKKSDVHALYKEGGEAWTDLMDDILVFYVCRHKLFGTLFPCVVDPKLSSRAEKNGFTKWAWDSENE